MRMHMSADQERLNSNRCPALPTQIKRDSRARYARATSLRRPNGSPHHAARASSRRTRQYVSVCRQPEEYWRGQAPKHVHQTCSSLCRAQAPGCAAIAHGEEAEQRSVSPSGGVATQRNNTSSRHGKAAHRRNSWKAHSASPCADDTLKNMVPTGTNFREQADAAGPKLAFGTPTNPSPSRPFRS